MRETLESLGAFTAFTVFVAFVARTLVTRFLTRDIESYKQRLRAEHESEIEQRKRTANSILPSMLDSG